MSEPKGEGIELREPKGTGEPTESRGAPVLDNNLSEPTKLAEPRDSEEATASAEPTEAQLSEIASLLDDLVSSNRGSRGAAKSALKSRKDPAFAGALIQGLMERFPGVLTVNLTQEVLPPLESCGELLEVVVEFGPSIHPLVAKRLDAPDAASRRLASHFYASVHVPDVVQKLMQRLHDEEARVSLTAASAPNGLEPSARRASISIVSSSCMNGVLG